MIYRQTMTEKDFVIVIGREFGSGGRKVGKLLADRLGLPYFDKNLLSEAARELGFSHDILKEADEKRPSFFHAFTGSSFGNTYVYGDGGAMSKETIYNLQSKIIEKICHKGACVIVGRTADYIARNHPNLISIFLHAPESFRACRIIERGDALNEEEARKLLRKADSKRENFYNYYTGRSWGKASNYHLSIDASKLSAEETVELIVSFLRTTAASR